MLPVVVVGLIPVALYIQSINLYSYQFATKAISACQILCDRQHFHSSVVFYSSTLIQISFYRVYIDNKVISHNHCDIYFPTPQPC